MPFTEQERKTIDAIMARNLQDMTAEEVQLYARWTAENALRDAEFQNNMQLLERELQAKLEARDEVRKAAIDNLKAQKEKALKRLEVIENG